MILPALISAIQNQLAIFPVLGCTVPHRLHCTVLICRYFARVGRIVLSNALQSTELLLASGASFNNDHFYHVAKSPELFSTQDAGFQALIKV